MAFLAWSFRLPCTECLSPATAFVTPGEMPKFSSLLMDGVKCAAVPE
jgi:hypothetical protein